MIITVRQSEQSADRRRAFWAWCYANGFAATEVADPIVVDTDQQRLTISQWLPVSQPGDPDFPELRRDEFNRPLTEHRELPLVAPVPDWMLVEADELAA